MGFILFILFVLFLFVAWPLLRGLLFLQNMRRRVSEAFGGRQQQERSRRDSEDGYTAAGERKIYGSGDGEYADFEEMSGTIVEETSSAGGTRTVIEEQITDAEYEEIS